MLTDEEDMELSLNQSPCVCHTVVFSLYPFGCSVWEHKVCLQISGQFSSLLLGEEQWARLLLPASRVQPQLMLHCCFVCSSNYPQGCEEIAVLFGFFLMPSLKNLSMVAGTVLLESKLLSPQLFIPRCL